MCPVFCIVGLITLRAKNRTLELPKSRGVTCSCKKPDTFIIQRWHSAGLALGAVPVVIQLMPVQKTGHIYHTPNRPLPCVGWPMGGWLVVVVKERTGAGGGPGSRRVGLKIYLVNGLINRN